MPEERRHTEERRQRLEYIEHDRDRRQWNEDHPIAALSTLKEKSRRMEADIHDLDEGKVSKAEFEPVKRIVYGLVSLILLGVITAILSTILSSGTAKP